MGLVNHADRGGHDTSADQKDVDFFLFSRLTGETAHLRETFSASARKSDV